MDSSTSGASALPGNRLIAYIRSLAKAKKGLPYGLPVCAAPSHAVTSTDALLRLASLVGPYITIFQVHADIIEDWSDETIRQLTSLAKKYAFLLWEGGRILNSTIGVLGQQKAESREVRNALVDFVRKKYTKGMVKSASWANIATAWAPGVAVNNQAADILIPALKAAAREAVADAVQTIRTEITADSYSDRPPSVHGSLSTEPNGSPRLQRLESPHVSEESDNSSLGLPPRKASTISLIQTITQHTESSNDALHETEPENVWDFGAAPPPAIDGDLPPTPLLSRGLLLCLPSTTDSAFKPEYRRSCMAAAYANQDFVLGFLCGEPWPSVSQSDDEIFDLDSLIGAMMPNEQHQPCRDPDGVHETAPQHLALFSLIPHQLSSISDQQLGGPTTDALEMPPDSLNPLAYRLFSLVRQGIRVRDAPVSKREAATPQTGANTSHRQPNILHIPIVMLP